MSGENAYKVADPARFELTTSAFGGQLVDIEPNDTSDARIDGFDERIQIRPVVEQATGELVLLGEAQQWATVEPSTPASQLASRQWRGRTPPPPVTNAVGTYAVYTG